MNLRSIVAAFSLALFAKAAPVEPRQGAITALSSAQVAAYKPYTYFAGAGYCNPSTTKTWSCGENCNALPGFVTVASGGDGGNVQYWFVGYYPTWQSVVVVHQGTDPFKLMPYLTDANFFQEPLRQSLFPGISSSVQIHNGFGDAHAKAAPSVLAAVKTALSTYNAKKVTLIGHSLGGALALLDSIFLPLHLPSGITYKTVTYGQPRVGNQAFVDYVDSKLSDVVHINNKDDPIPIVPGRFLGFKHHKGEIHIKDNGGWVSCAGQDNELPGCTVNDVGNILIANLLHHLGPFDGVIPLCY